MGNEQENAQLKKIIERIKALAKQKGVTIQDMLLESGAGIAFINGMHQGKIPTTFRFKQVADYFNVSVDFLLTGKEFGISDVATTQHDLLQHISDLINDFTYDEYDNLIDYIAFLKSKRDVKTKK